MAEGLRPITRVDFSGGIDAVSSPWHIGKSAVPRLENYLLGEDRALNIRDGATTARHGPSGTQIILCMQDIVQIASPFPIFLLIVRGLSGQNQLYSLTGGSPNPWTLLGTFVTQYDLPQIIAWKNRGIIAAGYETPWVTDGGTAGPIAGTPLAVPTAPTVTPAGTTGAVTYTYVVVAFNDNGTTPASPPGSTNTGNPTLSLLNYNVLTWASVPLASGYHIYRTVGGTTTGRIAVVGSGVTNLIDIGLQGNNRTPPTVDTTTSVVPGANHLVLSDQVLFAWNTAATNSNFDGPSSLRQSSLNSYTNWPTQFQVFVAQDDGQTGTGIGAFTIAETGISPDHFVVLFKEYSAYLVHGTFSLNVDGSLNTPTIEPVKTNMGCLAGRSIKFVTAPSVYGLIRFTHLGFALFDGLNDTVISDRIRPYIFGGDDLVGVDFTQVAKSYAVLSVNPLMYCCACPLVGTPGLTRMFCFDLHRRAWTICTFPVPFASFTERKINIVPPAVVAGAYGGDQIQVLFTGATTDDGAAISARVRVQPLGTPSQRGYVRRCLLTMYHVLDGQSITGTFVVGPAARSIQTQVNMRIGTTAQDMPGSPFQAVAEADVPFDVGLSGEDLYCEFQMTAQAPAGIRAITWHVRPKPLSRPVTV